MGARPDSPERAPPAASASMSCSRCGLTLGARRLAIEHCPRCLAQARKLVVLRPADTRGSAGGSEGPR